MTDARQLVCYTADDPYVVRLSHETNFRNSERVRWLSSAGWGYMKPLYDPGMSHIKS